MNTTENGQLLINKAEEREIWPLTGAELRIATECRTDPKSTAYNINFLAYRVNGPLDLNRLKKALETVIAKNRVLRSYYPQADGEYARKINPDTSVELNVIKCSEQDAASVLEGLNAPYDISGPPLYRFTVLDHDGAYTVHFGFHHLIMDGGGFGAFVDMLNRAYAGEEISLPEIDYLDFAVWLQNNADTAQGGALFGDMFKDGIPETEMPTVPVRPDRLPAADTVIETEIQVDTLKSAVEKYGVTRYEFLLGALGITLAKYTGTEDVVIGSPMDSRAANTRGMPGMFANTLPLRIKPAATLSAADYMGAVKKQAAAVKAHKGYPFEKLVPQLAPDRTPARNPVYDVIFNYLREFPAPVFDGTAAEPLNLKREALNIDMVIEAVRAGGKYRLMFNYSPQLYDPCVISNFTKQYLSVVNKLAACGPETPLKEVAELPLEQKRVILEDFAGKKTGAAGETVVSLFRKQAKKIPDKRAVVYGEKSLTYKELDDITDRLAAHLYGLGIRRGDTVGIMVNRGLMMPVGAIGAMKAGAAYLPLDPAYPSERLSFMAGDAGAKIIIADTQLKDKIAGYGGNWLDSNDVFELPQNTSAPDSPAPDDTMILLYTSGTTGTPKGVMLTHANITNFIGYYTSKRNLTENDVIPAYASFGFDACMMDMYPTLTVGAELHIIPEEMRLDLTAIKDYFNKNGVTAAFMTTQLGRQFADMGGSTALRALSVGGETLAPVNPPAFSLYNVYGPTECTVFVTDYEVDKLYDRIPIGRAVDNAALYIVDSNGALAPVGVAGELLIAGAPVAKGYLNRPDLTAEKFVENPFSDDPNYRRVYRTGDIARFLPNGSVDFVGRRDMQVKIRGFRVELTEIEARIREFKGIKDATVTAIDDAGGGKRIVAYVVSDTPVDINALNAFIAQTLPPYMVPSATMQIERIPFNQNGKVDKRKLPPVTIAAEEIVAPATVTENLIFDVISGIIGAEGLGVTTDLMYAGLNSLSAIKAAAQLTERAGKKLTAPDIMRQKTIRRLAALLDDKEAYKQKVYDKRDEYPLTQNQMGLYFACVKEPDSLVYNIPFELSFGSSADAKKLSESVKRVIDAHPYIKTRVAMRGAEPVQLRQDGTPAQVTEIQCGYEEYLKLKENFVQPFNFFDGPLYRINVYDTDKGVFMLADFHHMIFDGGSLDIFLRDMADSYAGDAPAPETFTSFDLSAQEAEEAKGQGYEKAKAYYAERLSDMQGATAIPGDFAAKASGNAAKVSFKTHKNNIKQAAKGMGVTPANLFLAAAGLVTGRYTGTRDVRIAAITNGRDGAERQRNLGMLVKTMPLILYPAADITAKDYIKSAESTMGESLSNLIYPYTQAASDFNYSAGILYAFQGGVLNEYEFSGEPVKLSLLNLDRAKFPVSINIWEDGSYYTVEAEYDDALYAKNTMEEFVQSVAHTASMLLDSPDKPLKDLSVASDSQRKETASFNPPQAQPKDSTLVKIFEDVVTNKPVSQALYAKEGTYTFAELNAAANRIANSLIEAGVEKGARVGIMLPRDGRIIASMLGVMKAGAAYIPIDPEYPKERIDHVLSDSKARFIITDKAAPFDNALNVDKLLAGKNSDNPNVPLTGEDSAYIIYTSGSTGLPKGVEIKHSGISNFVAEEPENIHVRLLTENNCSMLSITTVSFDAFLMEAFVPIMNGLRLILADDEQSKNPDKLAELIKESGADAMLSTPSRMLQYIELDAVKDAVKDFKVMVAGGEAYSPHLYNKLKEVTNAVQLNGYGPTETTVASNNKVISNENITVGPPQHGFYEEVMDIEGQPLPAGATGELWIAGLGVSKGYVGKPEMTAERFPQKFGRLWYKSGDLAKWNQDGEIVILGRNDGQIKLRGLRIELGEIENAIASQEGVTGCTVAVKKLRGQDHLCAYYTADKDITPEELRENISKTLTKYMVPTAYLRMDSLPMTPNGKTDKKALPEAKLLVKEEYSAPENETERAFCEIFAEALKLERVGAADNFFDLGGTSLLVTQVAIDAAKRGITVSYGDVFANPTPRELAAAQKQAPDTSGDAEITEFDYCAIHDMLKENNIESLTAGKPRELGNICVSGATGFLGIHVLHEFLKNETGTAYCIVRGGKTSAEQRLKSMLVYYFSDDFESLFGSRIIPIDGDITDKAVFEKLKAYPIDTYINCAANVKHFSSGTDIEDVNVKGTKNAVDFCIEKGCRFIQISTSSTAGMSVDGSPDKDTVMDETMLYFGQDLKNKYTRSKFLAERITLDAAQKGLDAKVMRVGNLMARDSDGEFQANFKTNSFLGSLKAYHIVGRISYPDMGLTTEFAPIDCTAHAILELAKTPEACRVFHPYNDHTIYMGDVVYALKEKGIDIQPGEVCEYRDALSAAMQDKKKAKHLNSLIAYNEYGRVVAPIKSSNTYTSQALMRAGFLWPITEKNYLKTFFEMMDGLGFFDN